MLEANGAGRTGGGRDVGEGLVRDLSPLPLEAEQAFPPPPRLPSFAVETVRPPRAA